MVSKFNKAALRTAGLGVHSGLGFLVSDCTYIVSALLCTSGRKQKIRLYLFCHTIISEYFMVTGIFRLEKYGTRFDYCPAYGHFCNYDY